MVHSRTPILSLAIRLGVLGLPEDVLFGSFDSPPPHFLPFDNLGAWCNVVSSLSFFRSAVDMSPYRRIGTLKELGSGKDDVATSNTADSRLKGSAVQGAVCDWG